MKTFGGVITTTEGGRMNNNQATLQKLESMRLWGMLRAFRSTMETGVKNQFTPDVRVNSSIFV